MAERLYIMHVKYTNASKLDDQKVAVIADGPSDAMRYLMDANVVGSEMSTINLTETDMAVVIPGYICGSNAENGLTTVIQPR